MNVSSRRFIMTFSAIAALALAGCTSSRNVGHWQTALLATANDSHNGDLTFVRENAGQTDRPGFTLLAADDPAMAQDVIGVLVGMDRSADAVRYAFLVATVRDGAMLALQPAMLTDRAGVRTWATGESDEAMLATYRGQDGSSSETDSRPLRVFPRARDRFEAAFTADGVAISETVSGAKWVIGPQVTMRAK